MRGVFYDVITSLCSTWKVKKKKLCQFTLCWTSNTAHFLSSVYLQNSVGRVAVSSASRLHHHDSNTHHTSGTHHHHSLTTGPYQEDSGGGAKGTDSGKDCSGRGDDITECVTAFLSSSGHANDQHQRCSSSGGSRHHHKRRGWVWWWGGATPFGYNQGYWTLASSLITFLSISFL